MFCKDKGRGPIGAGQGGSQPMKNIGGMKLYEVEDLVRMLKLSRVTVQAYLRADRIRGVKIGKRWHVTDSNLRDFLTGNTKGKDSAGRSR